MTLTVGKAFDRLFGADAPFHVVAYDGSTGGRPDGLVIRLLTERGLNYLLTAPGMLGMARAYLMGDLLIDEMNEGDPYEVLSLFGTGLVAKRPSFADAAELAAFVGRAGVYDTAAGATPRRSATTTTSRTRSTSWCSVRR